MQAVDKVPEAAAVHAPQVRAALQIPFDPWNGSPGLSDAPALRLGLAGAATGSATELALLLRLSCALRFVNGWEAALLALRARRLARRLGDPSSQAMAAAFGSACYATNGRERLSYAVAQAAVRRCSTAVDSATQIYLQIRLALAFQRRGQLSAAVDIYSSLLSRTYLARFVTLRALMLSNLGAIASQARLFHHAVRLHLAAQRVSAVVPVPRSQPRAYNNNLAMGIVCLAQRAQQSGQQEEARRLAEQAVGLARDALDYNSRNEGVEFGKEAIHSADTLAQALYLSGRSDDALAVVETIKERIARMALDPGLHLGGKSVHAQVLLERGEAAAAVAVAEPAFVQMRNNGSIDDAMDLAVLLAQAHEQLGQWRQAFEYEQWLRQTSERQGRERVAQEITDLANKLDLGRSDLMPYLAHELRSPLASVLALLDANRGNRPLTAAQHGDVRERVAIALDTAERVLDYARLQSLRQIEQRTFDLFALLDDACDEVGLHARARGVQIVLEQSSAIFTSGERTLLLRTVVGLLDNALRHSPPGATVRVQLEEQTYCIRLCIEDDGPGFNLDEVAGLFERKAAIGGDSRINLGLPLAARVIALHDGALLLDNGARGGAKVIVALPCATAPAVHPGTTERPVSSNAAWASSPLPTHEVLSPSTSPKQAVTRRASQPDAVAGLAMGPLERSAGLRQT
jgi:signal transduction histidine kinase